MLDKKNIVVGITGGIAAYKAAELVSRLRKLNAVVSVVLTKSAAQFITPLTLQTLSNNKVIQDLFDIPEKWEVGHVSLAKKADLFIIVPATANIIGKLANGICDDFLTTTLLATKSKVILVPSMNSNMFNNKIFQQNLSKLKDAGYFIMHPESGRLACGDYGIGRMPDVDDIIKYIYDIIVSKHDLKGKKILITAGPTREYIDPVRFITNASSGKMGYSIAQAAALRGAEVVLVSGPVNISPPQNIKQIIKVKTALQMYNAVIKLYDNFDIIIKTAAVSDYRPIHTFESKIKKSENNLSIEMTKNPDILFELGKIKGDRILVGFAAETEDIIVNAKQKLIKKNLDMIVVNNVTDDGAGFETDTNIVKIIKKNGDVLDIPKMNKEKLAHVIIDNILLI